MVYPDEKETYFRGAGRPSLRLNSASNVSMSIFHVNKFGQLPSPCQLDEVYRSTVRDHASPFESFANLLLQRLLYHFLHLCRCSLGKSPALC